MKSKFLTLLLILISCNQSSDSTCIEKNCADYFSQSEAQTDFNADPDCRNDLDADNDGMACEDFFNAGNPTGDCPNTSNCGCSGKNKSECNTNCCAWIVGQGCKCR